MSQYFRAAKKSGHWKFLFQLYWDCSHAAATVSPSIKSCCLHNIAQPICMWREVLSPATLLWQVRTVRNQSLGRNNSCFYLCNGCRMTVHILDRWSCHKSLIWRHTVNWFWTCEARQRQDVLFKWHHTPSAIFYKTASNYLTPRAADCFKLQGVNWLTWSLFVRVRLINKKPALCSAHAPQQGKRIKTLQEALQKTVSTLWKESTKEKHCTFLDVGLYIFQLLPLVHCCICCSVNVLLLKSCNREPWELPQTQ